MQRLSLGVFNQARSYLDYVDLHRTRAVCKQWENINEVEKRVYVKRLDKPKHHHSISNMNFRKVCHVEISYDPHTYSRSSHPMNVLERIFRESRNSLRSLRPQITELPIDIPSFFPNLIEIDFGFAAVDHVFIKLLRSAPNLQKLRVRLMEHLALDVPPLLSLKEIYFDFFIPAEVACKILHASPAVQTMRLGGGIEEFELDFALVPNLKSVKIDFPWKVTYLNHQRVQVKSIEFVEDRHEFMDPAFETICKWVADFHQAKVDFNLEMFDDEAMFSMKISIEGDFVTFLNFQQRGDKIAFTEELGEALRKLRRVRKFKFLIAEALQNKHMSVALDLWYFLKESKAFNEKQLDELL